MDYRELLKKAKDAKENAYAPYSGFRVGAALLTAEGRIYTGCNVENASYGAAICAERAAISCAVSRGERRFEAIAIESNGEGGTFPCGICRQVIAEFGPDIKVIVGKADGDFRIYEIRDLIPHAFTAADIIK